MMKILNTNIITYFQSWHLILIILLGAGCTTSAPRQDLDIIYQGYEGSRLPPEQIATVYLSNGPMIRVISIDNKNVNNPNIVYIDSEATYQAEEFSRAELSPGLHIFLVWVSARKATSAIASIQAILQPGHTYFVNFDNTLYANTSSHYAARMIDKSSGDVVGGRMKDALDWSWGDVQNILQTMSQEGETHMDVIEQFGVPMALYPQDMVGPRLQRHRIVYDEYYPENTLVYTISKNSKPPFVEIGFDESANVGKGDYG